MSYADLDCPLKTDENFQTSVDEPSILCQIPRFGLVSGIVLDYMHVVLLGVVRKLLFVWLAGPLNVRLPGRTVNVLSASLTQLVGFVPKEFVRKPRSLIYVKRFKATEYRQFLLYTGPVALAGNLPPVLYQHFLVLHVAISLLCHSQRCVEFRDYAKSLLRYFVEAFMELYGRKFVSHNVHNLIHLADDVANFGHLANFSAFPFENFYQSLKKLVRKGEKPLEQLARRYGEKEKRDKCNTREIWKKKYQFRGLHSSGPTLGGCCAPQYRICTIGGSMVIDSTSEANNTCVLEDGSIVVVKNFATERFSGTVMVVGKEYSVLEDLYSLPCRSSSLGIFVTSEASCLKMWPISSISRKCFRMPYKDKFAVVPMLHYECGNLVSLTNFAIPEAKYSRN